MEHSFIEGTAGNVEFYNHLHKIERLNKLVIDERIQAKEKERALQEKARVLQEKERWLQAAVQEKESLLQTVIQQVREYVMSHVSYR